jgi:hypothetical protein
MTKWNQAEAMKRAWKSYNSPSLRLKRWMRTFLGIDKELEMIHKDLSLLMVKQMDMQDAFEKAGWLPNNLTYTNDQPTMEQ